MLRSRDGSALGTLDTERYQRSRNVLSGKNWGWVTPMNLWLDLANSPQVLFFRPIVDELQRRGHKLSITLRDFAQTRSLADHYGLEYVAFGEHGGRSRRRAITANLNRTGKLVRWASGRHFDLAISSNVYSHVLACSIMRLPLVNLYDYDPNPANHIAFRLARRVIVPEPFPDEALQRYGAKRKSSKYPGVKEEVYLGTYQRTPAYREAQGLPVNEVLVVMRPPSDWSPYHRFPNPLFDHVLEYAARHESTFIVFLPRIAEQGDTVKARGYPNVVVAEQTYYGPDLISHADLVISAGGTMNREAAVLGTPVYTVYAGELGATDIHLIKQGRLRHIKTEADFGAIRFERRSGEQQLVRRDLVPQITDLILG
jgi:predicted glycosyltransferase